jgi:hypothetical protein
MYYHKLMDIRSILGIITMIGLGITITTVVVTNPILVLQQQSVEAFTLPGFGRSEPKAPMVALGDNLYTVWWTNKSGNWEVMFRASNDSGQMISDKINLSNSADADSQNAEIAASGNNVYVSWWETSTNPANKTSESVLRISNDNGNTFGPTLMLGNNGTLTGSN